MPGGHFFAASLSLLRINTAINLLAQPDKTGMVDLNNGGLVEVGKARLMTFTPVNAPLGVKQAWGSATANGIHLGSHAPVASELSQEQQWSTQGWHALLEKLRSTLDFSVSMGGWTRTNRVRQDFFNKFENELANMPLTAEDSVDKASGRQV